MHMTGEERIDAPRQKVWEALNDPSVLEKSIPGCQSLEKEADDRFAAVAEVRIGPIGARFKGSVVLSDIDAPNGYTITGSGNGGIAGSAKGIAKVRLSDTGDGGTLITYEVEAEVGGRMAQLGGPIIDATAKNLAGRFFSRFAEVVGGSTDAAAPVAAGRRAPSVASAASTPLSIAAPAPMWGWVAALVVALLTGFALGVQGTRTELVLMIALVIVTAGAAYEAGRRGGSR